ncbi:glucan endo-1,3-beta-glucosidase-like [Zingiber officinale]|uniref:glucan endo-1,3-beta-glucosidase-like n=1 Tax=Zingiber officinale TaxID=94328 RepID=UPI001C4D5A47|nr:glucan endo-1,3-beta-glucosidase-like [Zingiber officinale]
MTSAVRNSTILLLLSLFLLLCLMNGRIVLASGNGPWCILNLGVPEEAQQANIQYSCGGGIADCSAMQEGGPCWSPDIGRMAAYAMNAYYYAAGHKDINCDFKGTGTIITFDPSDAKCDYPS